MVIVTSIGGPRFEIRRLLDTIGKPDAELTGLDQTAEKWTHRRDQARSLHLAELQGDRASSPRLGCIRLKVRFDPLLLVGETQRSFPLSLLGAM